MKLETSWFVAKLLADSVQYYCNRLYSGHQHETRGTVPTRLALFG